jgi:hypothetical protein
MSMSSPPTIARGADAEPFGKCGFLDLSGQPLMPLKPSACRAECESQLRRSRERWERNHPREGDDG